MLKIKGLDTGYGKKQILYGIDLEAVTGKTVLIVEQKVREVLEVRHHVYSIKLGKIAYSGKPEIIKNDKDKLRELFL